VLATELIVYPSTLKENQSSMEHNQPITVVNKKAVNLAVSMTLFWWIEIQVFVKFLQELVCIPAFDVMY
jgi:hypothetical protein